MFSLIVICRLWRGGSNEINTSAENAEKNSGASGLNSKEKNVQQTQTSSIENGQITDNVTASAVIPTVRCPVCGQFFSTDIIVNHSASCADQKYANVIEIDDEDEEEEEDLNKSVFEQTQTEISQKSLKEIIESCTKKEETSVTIRVRRNYAFDDFSEKISKPWMKKKVGMPLYIVFLGESGVDQGGVSRDFFSGTNG